MSLICSGLNIILRERDLISLFFNAHNSIHKCYSTVTCKVFLNWPHIGYVVQYNTAPEKDRFVREGAMLPDGGAMLPEGYITSMSQDLKPQNKG